MVKTYQTQNPIIKTTIKSIQKGNEMVTVTATSKQMVSIKMALNVIGHHVVYH